MRSNRVIIPGLKMSKEKFWVSILKATRDKQLPNNITLSENYTPFSTIPLPSGGEIKTSVSVQKFVPRNTLDKMLGDIGYEGVPIVEDNLGIYLKVRSVISGTGYKIDNKKVVTSFIPCKEDTIMRISDEIGIMGKGIVEIWSNFGTRLGDHTNRHYENDGVIDIKIPNTRDAKITYRNIRSGLLHALRAYGIEGIYSKQNLTES